MGSKMVIEDVSGGKRFSCFSFSEMSFLNIDPPLTLYLVFDLVLILGLYFHSLNNGFRSWKSHFLKIPVVVAFGCENVCPLPR